MSDTLTPEQFTASEGVDDWRVVDGMAQTVFSTGSFNVGVRLVDRIGELADTADHHPDVDLRYPTVTVRLISHDVGGLSDRDVSLAGQISAAAAGLGIPADPSALS